MKTGLCRCKCVLSLSDVQWSKEEGDIQESPLGCESISFGLRRPAASQQKTSPPASCNPVTTPPPHRPSITQRGVYYPTCRMEGHRDRFVLSDRGSSEASMSCCLTNVDMMKEEILIAALSHINNKQNYLMDVHLCTCGSLSICKYADLDYSSQT